MRVHGQPQLLSEVLRNLVRPCFKNKEQKIGLGVKLGGRMPLGSIPSTTKTTTIKQPKNTFISESSQTMSSPLERPAFTYLPEFSFPSNCQKSVQLLHWPGIEPGPPAWQARILPLNHQCFLSPSLYFERWCH